MTVILQEGGAYEILSLIPDDAQCRMMIRQREFQRSMERWDDRLSDRPPTFCLPGRVLHSLDSAVQEASEAWDMLQGGWKHHRRNPPPVNRTELVLELVDVAAFLMNAYLFMGGQPEAEMIARVTVGTNVQKKIVVPAVTMEHVWHRAVDERERKFVLALYSHGWGAHGDDWVKTCAAHVNFLRSQVSSAAEVVRRAMAGMTRAERSPEKFPANAGWLYAEVFPALYGAFASIPDCTPQEAYSAYVHKADVNDARQKAKY
jgi:hypothetical protein